MTQDTLSCWPFDERDRKRWSLSLWLISFSVLRRRPKKAAFQRLFVWKSCPWNVVHSLLLDTYLAPCCL